MNQLDLPLGWPADACEAEFIVTAANAEAVHLVEHWATWPVCAALLVGPRKSGRSLLSRVFAAKTGGTVIDDAERVPEVEIFHAWNRAQADRRPLLIVADEAPPEWRIRLPDLRSRLGATPVLRIQPPDDELMSLLLQQRFERHEVFARADVIDWLTRRIERSYVTLMRVVDILEQEAAMRRGRRLSIPVARAALERARLVEEEEGRAA